MSLQEWLDQAALSVMHAPDEVSYEVAKEKLQEAYDRGRLARKSKKRSQERKP